MKTSDVSLEHKVAQMMVFAYRDPGQIQSLVRAGAGGVWPCGVPRDSVEKFRDIIRTLQSEAEIPLFISTDFEMGVGQLITGEQCTEFPGMMAFGAMAASDLKHAEELAYRAGCVVAEEADYLGINITPSPVFDVNTVPENPICNTRSVGDNPQHVAAVAVAYAKGMMSKGRLLPQAKHFPGEGMHKLDPHLGLEVMDVSREAMERIHLPPFAAAVAAGIPMMMTNHAIYPPYDPETPCTLSRALITGLLRETLGFDGLVITDAMEMHGITARFSPREALVRAVLAGNDLILGPTEPDNAVATLSQAVRDGDVPEAMIDAAVDRILKHKQAMGLTPGQLPENPLPTTPVRERRAMSETIAQQALTLIRNRRGSFPVKANPQTRVLVLEPEHPNHPLDWGLRFNMYGLLEFAKDYIGEDNSHMIFGARPTEAERQSITAAAGKADLVLVSTFFRSRCGQTGLLTAQQVNLLEAVCQACPQTVIVVSNPYVAAELPFANTILACYGSDRMSVQSAVQAIFSQYDAPGKLPVTLPDFIDANKIEIVAHD